MKVGYVKWFMEFLPCPSAYKKEVLFSFIDRSSKLRDPVINQYYLQWLSDRATIGDVRNYVRDHCDSQSKIIVALINHLLLK